MKKTYKKININIAEKLYNSDGKVLILPNKINPSNSWGIGSTFNKAESQKEFKTLLNEFSYYNCNDRQTGLKPAFYMVENDE